MYLLQTYNKADETNTHTFQMMACKSPFGPNFSTYQVDNADSMEVWSSSFEDKGEDFNEFRLMKGNEIIENRTISGY